MKPIKQISMKILIIILLTGMISISGIGILTYNIKMLSSNYDQILVETIQNQKYMSKIRSLFYQHQGIVLDHLLIQDESVKAAYEMEEQNISDEIEEILTEFGSRMTGQERASLFHKVYSNAYSYLKSADIVFTLSREGNTMTATYYNTTSMSDFITFMNGNLDELETVMESDLEKAQSQMERYILISNISVVICVSYIVVSIILCLIFCLRMTSRMDRYKDELEMQVQQQTKEILAKNEKMLHMQENTVQGMANLIENRDGSTGQHVKRTSAYVALLAKAAQTSGYMSEELTDNYIDLLMRAAPLHDVGKIVIPDHILKKEGPLTGEEFEQIKSHTISGGRIVYDVLGGITDQGYIDLTSNIATYHHEKWDGSGYPQGLSGTSIPLCARIMAIADVYDALVSKRCYKEPFSVDKAFEIIKKESGSHFDPILAELFIAQRADIEKIMEL